MGFGKQQHYGVTKKGLFKDPKGKHRKAMGDAIWLFLYYIGEADWDKGFIEETFYKKIKKETGIPERTAKRHTKRLRDKNYIKIGRTKNHGFCVWILKWIPRGKGVQNIVDNQNFQR